MDGNTSEFVEKVWDYYAAHQRDLPWRIPESDGCFDPYKILVSEVMLQQTQVNRVIPKFNQFLDAFPDVQTLAKASLSEVLVVWAGLGYNRRAKFLLQTATTITKMNSFPTDTVGYESLPGIGRNTAAAICVYAFNQPLVFIETNVRSVYIHNFFADKNDVSDKELLPLIDVTMDRDNPREWYWALMDYGTHIKSTYGNAARNSKHYTKQSRFEGSKRQLRARVLKSLLESPKTMQQIIKNMKDDRLETVISDLTKEEMIRFNNKHYYIA